MSHDKKALNPEDRERLTTALDTLHQVLGGDRIAALQDHVGELERGFASRLEAHQSELTAAARTATDSVEGSISQLRAELKESLDKRKAEAREEQQKLGSEMKSALEQALSDSRTKVEQSCAELKATVADLPSAIQRIEEQANQGLEELRKDLGEQIVRTRGDFKTDADSRQRDVDDRVQAARQEIDQLRGQLDQHIEATGRISALLNSMASVFNHKAPDAPIAEAATPVLTPIQQPAEQLASFPADEMVDNALERVFPEDG